jgi:hypothetical protein
MLAAELGVALTAGALLLFGGHIHNELRRIARADESLMDALERRLAFVHGKYELWLWAAALTCVLLAFALTTFIDNEGGVYRINKPLVFGGTIAGMLLFIYGSGKLATWAPVHEMRDALLDLKEGTSERIAAAPRRRRIVLWVMLVLALVLTATAVLGLLVAVGR